MNQIEFGVFLSPEILIYPELEKRTKYIEEKGYHSIWLSDHLLGVYENENNPRLESWTALTALALKTTKVKLGHLTLAVPFRNPALLVKMASTLDIVSRGRAILSIGAGWHEREFRAYGYKFGSKLSRSDRLEEAAAIIKKMMTEDNPTFSGKYYTINKAYNSPKPVQEKGVPLMIAGEGEKRTLRTCALYGDMSNYAIWRGSADDFMRKTQSNLGSMHQRAKNGSDRGKDHTCDNNGLPKRLCALLEGNTPRYSEKRSLLAVYF